MNKLPSLSRALLLAVTLTSHAFAEPKESAYWLAFKEAKDRSPANILTDFSKISILDEEILLFLFFILFLM